MPCNILSRVLSATLMAVGVTLGFFAPTFAGSPDAVRTAAQAAVQTRIVSCAGFDFHPVNSDTDFAFVNRQIARTTDDGDGWFMCAAQLPHKAVVRKVRFTLNDGSTHISLDYCGLVRTSLKATGAVQALAFAATGTGVAATPFTVRYSTTSIDFATVDNANYAYSLQCRIVFDDTATSAGPAAAGIIGADVTYTISAANG